MSNNLPLNSIVDVAISVGPVNKVRSNFDLGLIIGKSQRISSSDRVKIYSSTNEMKLDGFRENDPEYEAALIYFSQSPAPSRVAIGVIVNKKENESDADDFETIKETLTACRSVNTEWYGCSICDATKDDILSAAQYIEQCEPESYQFATTSDKDVYDNVEGNLMETAKKTGYSRTFIQYSSDKYAAVSAMAYVMANSSIAFDLAYKSEPGISVEDLDQTHVTMFKANNMNYYICRGSVYNVLEMGVSTDGTHVDEILNLDMLKNEIQAAIMNNLTTNAKIPQTDAGVEINNTALIAVLDKYVSKGFIAPGVWKGKNILTVKTGDVLSKGYLILNDSIDDQTQADREARKQPNTYILIKESGAIEHCAIGIYVNR